MNVINMRDGMPLHYRDIGTGKPVVFIHGWAATGAFFEKQIPLAGQGLRLIIPDLRGHGLSQHPDRNLTIALLARDLRVLIEHLKLAEVALVGWSMGAMVAWEYLRTWGASGVDKLSVVDMTARIVTDDDWVHGLAGGYPIEHLPQTVDAIRNDWGRVAKLTASKLFARHAAVAPGAVQECADLMRANHPAGLANLWADMAQCDFRAVLPRLLADSQFIHGMDSVVYTPETIAHVARLATARTVAGIPGAGHMPQWEQPQAFMAALRNHLCAP